MKRAFLICALPRSRTAWLSQFFTVGEVCCAHDLTAQFRQGEGLGPEHIDIKGLARAIVQQPGAVVGSSCAGNLWIARALEAELARLTGVYPNILCVRRPEADVLSSFARVCGVQEEKCRWIIEEGGRALAQEAARQDATTVDFCDLDDEAVARKAWHGATWGSAAQFPTHHWRKMRTMRVEIHPEIMFRAAHKQAA